MVRHVHRNRNRRDKGVLECYDVRTYPSTSRTWRGNYPVRDREDHHRDVKRCHDEEIENAVLENGSHQAGHARLAPNSLEPGDEDDDRDESNDVCEGVRVLNTRGR